MKLFLDLNTLPHEEDTILLVQALLKLTEQVKPLSVSLTMDDRKINRKMGSKRLNYVIAAQQYGEQYEDVMPRIFNSKELTERLDYYHRLVEIQSSLNHLSESINDTIMACGIDLMTLTRLVHDGLRTANMLDASYDSPLSKLDEFNKRDTGPKS